MWPLTTPSRVYPERCSSSHLWTTTHRTAAAQAHGRGGRRRPCRYLGINPSSSYEFGAWGLSTPTLNAKSAPQRQGKAWHLWEASASVDSGSLPQSARTETDDLARGLSTLALSDDQWQQSQRVATQILRAIDLCPVDSPIGRLFTCSTPAGGAASAGSAVSRQSIAVAALLLPSLTLQWLSVSDLDGWLERGAAHLLREALLVQKAANDASASVNELVGWCLDNCSGPAATLAALWGQQYAQALPPRSRSFYGLLLHRLGFDDAHRRGQQACPNGGSSSSNHSSSTSSCSRSGSGGDSGGEGMNLHSGGGGGRGLAAQLAVLCGSITRTAFQPSARGRATAQQDGGGSSGSSSGLSRGGGNGGRHDEGDDEGGENGVADGGARAGATGAGAAPGGGGGSRSGPTDADVIVLAELPAEAVEAQVNGSLRQQRPGAGRPPPPAPQGATGGREDGAQVNGASSSSGNGNSNNSGGDGDASRSKLYDGLTSANGGINGRPRGGGSDGGTGEDGGSSATRRGLFGSGSQPAAGLLDDGGGDLAATPLGGLEDLDGSGGDGGAGDAPALEAGSGSSRPTASLLQRPSRGVVQEPESAEYSDEDGPGEGPSAVATISGGSPAAVAAALGPGGGSGGGGGVPSSLHSSLLASAQASGALRGRPFISVRLVPTGRSALRDLTGGLLTGGLTVPETGPIVVSNDPRVFPGTEAIVQDYATPAGDKLAIRLEYIVDRSAYDEVTLQLFNISRVVRKRTQNCLMHVNGKPVNVGDPGVVLAPGDEVWFGHRAFAFRVEAVRVPQSPVQETLDRFCRPSPPPAAAAAAATDAPSSDGTSAPLEAAAAGTPSAPGHQSDAAAAAAASGEAASAGPPPPSSPDSGLAEGGADRIGSGGADANVNVDDANVDMAALSNMSRREPQRAEDLLRRLAARNPGDAAVWLIWAQMAARVEGPDRQAKARLLFRTAVAAARQMEVIPPPPAALEVARRNAMAGSRAGRRGRLPGGGAFGGGFASSMEEDDGGFDGDGDDQGLYGTAAAAPWGASPSAPAPSGASRARRHNWLLVQALGNWGKHEWRLRMYGSARHLFRAAVDEAGRHPGGIAGGGGAAIMHYWASRELEARNVRNARIVAAEALRKCPADVALYVLAASVELEGGNLELAKSYCQRAYSLDRSDKQLFLVWPRVEAALGDRLKARLLYERALDLHPLNTKIINLYARFEAEEGSYGEAAELYDRALRIDPLSPVMGVHNRADWASLEADLGNTPLARALLQEGLAAHPQSTPLLVTLAKVERLEGRYPEALLLIRTAQRLAGPFNPAVMTERAQVLRALGEREMAANLTRHVAAVRDLNRMKQQGYWGSEAWRAFIEGTRSPEQQAVVAAARTRRLELGWATAVRGVKPQPRGEAGQGRRPAAPEAQQWMQLEQLRQRRAEARRLAAQRAAQVRAGDEEGGEGVMEEGRQQQPGVRGPSGPESSSEDDYYEDDGAVNVPSLDSVRRPMPGDEDGYDVGAV